MPPKAKKVKQQKTSATAATKGASKKPTTVDTSTLSIAERVALRNVDRQFRLESSSSSSSSESDAQEPPRRGAKKKVPTKQTRPMAAAVATKKARAPSPKKLPPPPPAKAKKAPPKAPTAATVKKTPPPKKGKGSRASSTAPPSAKPSPQRGNKRSTTVTSRSSSLPRSSPQLSQETDPVVPIIALVSSSTSSHRNHHEEEGQERDASSLLPSASPHRNEEEDEVRLPMSLLTPEKVVGEEDDAGVLSLFSPGAVGATSSSNSDDDDDVGVRPHETTTVPIVRERGAGGEPSPLQVVREHSSGRGMSITARPSAMLIAKAAATKPQQSPQTMWISLSSDDDDDPDNDVMEVVDGRDRRHSSQSPDPTVLGGGGGSAAASGPSHSPSPPDARNGRTPLPGGGAGSPPGLRFATPSTSSLPAPLVPALLATNTQATQLLLSPLPSSVTMRDVLPPTFRARKAHEGRVKHPPPPGAKVIDVDEEDARGGGELTQRMENNGQQWVPGRLAHPLHRPGATAAVAATVPRWITPQQQPMALPTRRVPLKRDRPLDSQAPDDSDVMPPPAPRPTSTAAGQHPGHPNAHHHRGNSTTTQQVMSSSPTSTYFTPNKYAEGRPVDVLKPLFPKTFTKEGFLDMAAKVVTKSHCLPSSEFWEAFTDVAYLGEGSFGLVWRCKTLDGDVVAVKSCPLSFHSPEAIDDGFSVLREVAVMRFLNEQHVPYVLPLHNAFFVNGTEALPPHVSEVVCLHSKVETEVTRRKKRRLRKNPNMTQEEFERATSTVYDVVAKYILSEEEYAHLTTVKRPKFFAISELDALECEATMFLVVELCDGDVEEVQRSDAVSRGVAYCVSSALAAMHRLGLVHLDLKPSNILYACERSGAGGDGASSGVTAMKFYLSDFGNCHIVGSAYKDEIRDAVGTYEYMDTQALEEKRCSRATDCFSLGCTLYELLMFARLYQPSCKCEEHSRHCFLPQSQGPFLISSTTVLHKVTELLLATDRSKRLTAAGCLTYLVNALGITSHHAAARAPTGGAARDLFAESSPSASSSELKVSSSTKRRITASMNDDNTTDPSSYHNPLLDEEHHNENGIESLPMSPSQRSLALASTPQRVRFSSTPTAFRGSPHHQ